MLQTYCKKNIQLLLVTAAFEGCLKAMFSQISFWLQGGALPRIHCDITHNAMGLGPTPNPGSGWDR